MHRRVFIHLVLQVRVVRHETIHKGREFPVDKEKPEVIPVGGKPRFERFARRRFSRRKAFSFGRRDRVKVRGKSGADFDCHDGKEGGISYSALRIQ